MYLSILGSGYELRIVAALSFLLSTQNLKFPSFIGSRTTAKANLVCAGSIIFVASLFSILILSNTPALYSARHGTKSIGRIVGDSRSIRCFMVSIRPKYPFHIDWGTVRRLTHSSLYFEYSLKMTND